MGHKVFLSPSDQTANTYAAGSTNEAEQCGRIAGAAKAALERCGFEVMVVQYETMASKCAKSDAFGAELHVPIHSNAFNGRATGTRIYFGTYGSAGHMAAKAILARLGAITPGSPDICKDYPELYEIRTPKAPTAYIETDFHDNKEVARWIIDHTEQIGEAICAGICDYFGVAYVAEEKEENEMRYYKLKDIDNKYYKPTMEKLVSMGVASKGGSGEDTIIDLGEDAVRLLCILDKLGKFDEIKQGADADTVIREIANILLKEK